MSYYSKLLDNIKHYVTYLFQQSTAEYLTYHNLSHTTSVVDRVQEIANNCSFDELDFFVVSVSAWFHDTGHLNGGLEFHEDRSVKIMKEFMTGKDVADEIIEKIEHCICATKLLERPKTLLDEIICDADTFHFGTAAFINTDRLLRKEFELRNINVDNWEEKTLQLLSSHRYYTKYCNTLLTRGKDENITLFRQLLIDKKNK